MRILVVEDTEDLGRLVEFTLRGDGHEVHWARDGKAFFEALAGAPPELVILDVGLPDASGLDLLRHLREKSATAATPVLMLTANSALEVMEAALDAGANSYLVKPFAPSVLRRRVAQLGNPPAAPEGSA